MTGKPPSGKLFSHFLNTKYGSHHKQQEEIKTTKKKPKPTKTTKCPLKLLKASSHSQGCQAGSILQRLSRLLAAATRVLTLLSPPSNWARLWSRVMMAVTAFWTRETSCWLSMFSGCPAADSGDEVSSWVFLCHAMISSLSTVFRMPSTYTKKKNQIIALNPHNAQVLSDYRIVTRFQSTVFWHFWCYIAISYFSRRVWLANILLFPLQLFLFIKSFHYKNTTQHSYRN